MTQQNQSIAEELQKERAAKVRQEVEVRWLLLLLLLLLLYDASRTLPLASSSGA